MGRGRKEMVRMKFWKYMFTVAAAAVFPLIMSAQSRIVKDFTPICDSIAVSLSERTGVQGELRLKNIMRRNGNLDFYFTVSFSDFPWRQADYSWFRDTLRALFPDNYSRYRLGEIYSRNVKAGQLIFEAPGNDGSPSGTRYRGKDTGGRINPLVTGIGKRKYTEGMEGRHIAVWPSHGRYYDQNTGKWRWQRPCLFTTVEDMLSTGFVLSYLVPMLENAGAYVMLPRERDTGTVEIIIDNDPSSTSRAMGSYSETGKWADAGEGFADTSEVYTGPANPFRAGSSRSAACTPADGREEATARWTPDIPSRGRYAVYVSYRSLPNSTSSAMYAVHHLGGTDRFIVNQQIGGGTWIYLGSFEFDEGTSGYVELLNRTPEGRKYVRNTAISADAVKIGGGMGNIARNVLSDSLSVPSTSGMPRYAEAARYWLQWAGMDTTIFSQHGEADDYRDDLFSRGDWVDFMSGGSSVRPGREGGGIPFDLAFAFHSDAGVTPNDSTVGTLVIYTRTNERMTRLPDGEDRLTAREFADILQSQITADIRHCIDSSWTRRQIWDRAYRESRTPPCPTVLLENFSHQNFADMRLALDPSFRFVLSRAIYKGILKYLSNRYGCTYTVQPLPVRAFSAVLQDSLTVGLSWRPRTDISEPTAVPDGYMLYTRIDDGAFDRGRPLKVSVSPDGRVSASAEIRPGHIYSYMITAVNDGGESFPSEVLAVGIPAGQSSVPHNDAERDMAWTSNESLSGQAGNRSLSDQTILIVNNFTRVSAPAWFDTPDVAGFHSDADAGMPYMRDISYIGDMYEFRRTRPWTSDANPGFGASSGEYAGKPVTGNTFDYPYVHGKAIMAAGYPFCSASAEAFSSDSTLYGNSNRDSTSVRRFIAADIICGEQVTTLAGAKGFAGKYRIFPAAMQSAIREFTRSGGDIIVSGSHIGTDIWDSIFPVSTDSTFRQTSIAFAEDVLGYRHVTGHASRTNCTDVFCCPGNTFQINRDIGKPVYRVVSPDSIAPSGDTGKTIAEYGDTGFPAGIFYTSPSGYRTICFGFPIEAAGNDDDIFMIISGCLDMLFGR